LLKQAIYGLDRFWKDVQGMISEKRKKRIYQVELTTLIRMWILEDLEKLEKQQPEGVPAFSLPWVGDEIHPLPHSTLVQLLFLDEPVPKFRSQL
jgi:hypothetical protein